MTKNIALIFSLLIMAIMSSCTDDSSNGEESMEDDNTEFEAPPVIKSSGELCALNAANIATNIPDYIKAQIESRMSSSNSLLSEGSKIVIASTAELSDADEALYAAYNRGATIVMVDADKRALLQWLDKHNIEYCGERDDFDHLHLIYAFNNRNRYLLFDDLEDEKDENEIDMMPVRFDSVISWLNQYAGEKDTPRALQMDTSRASDVYDITQTFGSQVVTHCFTMSLQGKELAHVASSKRDYLSMKSSLDVTLTIYPLFSKASNGSSKGDYYIVKGYVNSHNARMYAGKWTNKHGGVHARLCGFYMSKLDFSVKIDSSNANVKFPAGGTPVPQTTASSTSYASGFSWSIGGNITGKVDGGGIGGQVGVSGSCSWNNTETRTLPDVSIRRDTYNGEVKWEYTFNNLPHTSSSKKHLDIPDLATSDFESNYTWIWWMPDCKAGQTTKFPVKISVKPEFKSYHWYSSAADFSVQTWGDAISEKDQDYTFLLTPPRRSN